MLQENSQLRDFLLFSSPGQPNFNGNKNCYRKPTMFQVLFSAWRSSEQDGKNFFLRRKKPVGMLDEITISIKFNYSRNTNYFAREQSFMWAMTSVRVGTLALLFTWPCRKTYIVMCISIIRKSWLKILIPGRCFSLYTLMLDWIIIFFIIDSSKKLAVIKYVFRFASKILSYDFRVTDYQWLNLC